MHHLESGSYSELYINMIQDGIDKTLESMAAGLYILLPFVVLTLMKFQVCLQMQI
jgi:hypothetical protein